LIQLESIITWTPLPNNTDWPLDTVFEPPDKTYYYDDFPEGYDETVSELFESGPNGSIKDFWNLKSM